MLAEFEPQRAVLLALPKYDSDWQPYLQEVKQCVVHIVREIADHQEVILLCDDADAVRTLFDDTSHIRFIDSVGYDDTWMRDCSVLAVHQDNAIVYKDFVFNGWGGKFEASKDNAISGQLKTMQVLKRTMHSINRVLEGGGVESDGQGTIMTTASCLCNPNRNGPTTKEEVEQFLAHTLNAKRVLWLDSGHLEGDDTDGHIDTLARFCTPTTIAYVAPPPKEDSHYSSFVLMQKQLQSFRTLDNKPYRLIALPFVPAVYYDNERLPATYANFLITNEKVLVPTYNAPTDETAVRILQEVFIDKHVVGIDCSVLVRQHGSLHCMSMQLH